MIDQPFHHGRLRAELLERAERVVREDGPGAVSIRDLARQAGVSHGAPRRHFPDRKALLDAVAENGFVRLTRALETAFAEAEADPEARFRAGAEAYVHFAAEEARLHDLMFTMKTETAPDSLTAAADRFFAVSGKLLDPVSPTDAQSIYDPRRLLVIVSLQGIAALVAAGRLPEHATGPLLDEAARVFALADSS